MPKRSGQRAIQKRQSLLGTEDGFDNAATLVGLVSLRLALSRSLGAVEELLQPIHDAIKTGLRVLFLMGALLALIEDFIDDTFEPFDRVIFFCGHDAILSWAAMKVEVPTSATVDLATKGDLDSATREQRLTMSEFWAHQAELPIDLQAGKTTGAVQPTYTYLDLGGPRPGWLWDVMRIATGTNDPFTALSGASVIAYIDGKVPQDSANEGMYPQLVEISGTFGNVAFYGRQQVVVRPGQHLILVIKSAGNSVQLNGTGLAIQYRDPAAGQPLNTYRQSR